MKIVSFEFVEAYVRIECLNSFYDILRLFIDYTISWHTPQQQPKMKTKCESWAQSFTQLKEYKKICKYAMPEGHKEYKFEYTKKQIFDHKILLSKFPGMVSDNQKSDQHLINF